MNEQVLQLTLTDAEATSKLGVAIAQAVESSIVIALEGPLGAGKTTLIKGLGEGLGITETISSPTFTMLNEYHSGRLPLFHFDLYRIKDYLATQATYPSSELNILQCELDELMVTNCVIALEWADCFNQYLSNDFLLVKLTYLKDDGRLAILKGVGAKSQELVCKVKAILTDFLKGY